MCTKKIFLNYVALLMALIIMPSVVIQAAEKKSPADQFIAALRNGNAQDAAKILSDVMMKTPDNKKADILIYYDDLIPTIIPANPNAEKAIAEAKGFIREALRTVMYATDFKQAINDGKGDVALKILNDALKDDAQKTISDQKGLLLLYLRFADEIAANVKSPDKAKATAQYLQNSIWKTLEVNYKMKRPAAAKEVAAGEKRRLEFISALESDDAASAEKVLEIGLNKTSDIRQTLNSYLKAVNSVESSLISGKRIVPKAVGILKDKIMLLEKNIVVDSKEWLSEHAITAAVFKAPELDRFIAALEKYLSSVPAATDGDKKKRWATVRKMFENLLPVDYAKRLKNMDDAYIRRFFMSIFHTDKVNENNPGIAAEAVNVFKIFNNIYDDAHSK